MNFYELSRTILLLNRKPIGKIRFARLIYFVHKELIRKKFMTPDAIGYIRSPLGPVPENFLSLAEKDDIISKKSDSADLSYASEEYTIDANARLDDPETALLEQYREILKQIERTLAALNQYSTPDLVEMTHQDPSWQTHPNGELYYISAADLKNAFPFSTLAPIRIKIRFSKPTRTGAMQAKLLRGMINDIVKESTDLEYPDDPKTSQPPRPKKPTRIHLKIFKKGKNEQQ